MHKRPNDMVYWYRDRDPNAEPIPAFVLSASPRSTGDILTIACLMGSGIRRMKNVRHLDDPQFELMKTYPREDGAWGDPPVQTKFGPVASQLPREVVRTISYMLEAGIPMKDLPESLRNSFNGEWPESMVTDTARKIRVLMNTKE